MGPRPPGASSTFIFPELGFNRPYTLFCPVNQSTPFLSKVAVFQFAWGGPAATGKRLLTGSPGRPGRWRSARCQLSRALHQAQLSRRGDVTPIPTAYAGSGLSPDPASPVRRSLARCTRLHRREWGRHREVGTWLEAGRPLTLVRRELRRLVRRELGESPQWA